MSESEPLAPRRRPVIGRRLYRGWRGWREDPVDRFGVLLFFVVMTIVVSSTVDVGVSYQASLTVHTMSGAALVAAARATGMRRLGRRIIIVVVAVALVSLVVLAVAEAVIGPQVVTTIPPSRAADPLWLVLVLVVPVIVIRRLMQHSVVTTRTVLGTIAAYLQIGVAYAALYLAIDAWSERFAFGGPQPSSAYTYLSLTTMSTLGIGDIVPTTQLSRLVLASEAVLGQLFLVTVVAIVVSRFAGSGARDRRDNASG